MRTPRSAIDFLGVGTALSFVLVALTGCGQSGSVASSSTDGGVTSTYAISAPVVTYPVVSTSPTAASTETPPTLDPSMTDGGNISATLSNSASLSAPFNLDSTLTYQWTFNGVALPGATSQTLTINSVQTTSYGTYVVTASNAAGSAQSAPFVLTPVVMEVTVGASTCNGAQCMADENTAQQACQIVLGSQSVIYYSGAWSPSYVKWTTAFCDWIPNASGGGGSWSCNWKCDADCSGYNVLGYVYCLQ